MPVKIMNRAEPPRTVLVTGANGFAGRPTCEALAAAGWRVRGAFRALPAEPGPWTEAVAVGDIGPGTAWDEALRGVDAVIHLAARVHQMNDAAADPEAEFRRVNVEGTRRLADRAARAGVRRVVLVSSIKVNGEATEPGRPFTAEDKPAPQDPYGRSKAAAEAALRETAEATGLEWTVVRPPLMVGRGVKGNLRSLAGAIRRGLPLPLGAVTGNRRSLLDVRHLADLLVCCAGHPAAAGRIFLAADEPPVSTAELVRRLGNAVGRPARLVPVPPACLRLAARLAGRRAAVERLIGSLEIDARPARQLLGWSPSHGPADWQV